MTSPLTENVDKQLLNLSSLPKKVLLKIFGYLVPEDLIQVTKSSRGLYNLATYPTIWEEFYLCFWKEENHERTESVMLSRWRDTQRIRNLYNTAKTVMLKYRDNIEDDDKEIPPFPLYLSSTSASCLFEDLKQLNFYRLFCERIRIDQAVLQIIKEACIDYTTWPAKMNDIIEKYGNEAKDILVALITTQKRFDKKEGSYIRSNDNSSNNILGFPSALQVRKPSTTRSRSHHLLSLRLSEELLAYLREEQAFKGLEQLRLKLWQMQEDQKSYKPSWTEFSSIKQVPNNDLPLNITTAKQTENGVIFLSMLNVGEGYEIAHELDMLAVSCSLFLREQGIKLTLNGPQETARGIYKFMFLHGFRCTNSYTDRVELNKNFLHFSLDESGRKCPPFIFAVIFSSLSWRIGLSALPAYTPIGPMLAIHNSNKSFQTGSNNFYWLSIMEKGLIYQTFQIKQKFAQSQSNLLRLKAKVYTWAPLECCLEMIYNIQGSCQHHSKFGSTYVKSDTIQITFDKQDSLFYKNIHHHFERIILKDDNIFNPRVTSYNVYDRTLYLTSSVYPSPKQQQTSNFRSFQTGRTLASAGRFLQLFIRLPNLTLLFYSFKSAKNIIIRKGNITDLIELRNSKQAIAELDFIRPSQIKESFNFNQYQYSVGTTVVHWISGCPAVIIQRIRTSSITNPSYEIICVNGSIIRVKHMDIQPAAISLSIGTYKAYLSISQFENLLRARQLGNMFRCVACESDGSWLRLIPNAISSNDVPGEEQTYQGTFRMGSIYETFYNEYDEEMLEPANIYRADNQAFINNEYPKPKQALTRANLMKLQRETTDINLRKIHQEASKYPNRHVSLSDLVYSYLPFICL